MSFISFSDFLTTEKAYFLGYFVVTYLFALFIMLFCFPDLKGEFTFRIVVTSISLKTGSVLSEQRRPEKLYRCLPACDFQL